MQNDSSSSENSKGDSEFDDLDSLGEKSFQKSEEAQETPQQNWCNRLSNSSIKNMAKSSTSPNSTGPLIRPTSSNRIIRTNNMNNGRHANIMKNGHRPLSRFRHANNMNNGRPMSIASTQQHEQRPPPAQSVQRQQLEQAAQFPHPEGSEQLRLYNAMKEGTPCMLCGRIWTSIDFLVIFRQHNDEDGTNRGQTKQ
jgi:hypothetical protein